jgi:hypothetical protein
MLCKSGSRVKINNLKKLPFKGINPRTVKEGLLSDQVTISSLLPKPQLQPLIITIALP